VPLSGIPLGGASVTKRKIYRRFNGAGTYKLVTTLNDNTTTTFGDGVTNASLGTAAPVADTTAANRVSIAAIGIGASPTTSRKVYRTTVGGSQLKLLTTLADNITTTFLDTIADGSLGANAPTSDASGLVQPYGQVNAGSTSILTTGTGPFPASGGWAVTPSGDLFRYTGISGNTLTGIPASGLGALLTSVFYGDPIVPAPALIGIPASGAGSISYPILQGDQVNLLVQCDDLAAQAALATLMGGTDDGVVEDFIQDGTIGLTEALARGRAKLAQCSTVRISIAYDVRDKNSRAGRTIHVALPAPTNLTGDFMIQSVTIDTFSPALMPTFHVQASSDRFSLEDLLRMFRQAA
jgi:hypothetical protein